METVGEAGIRSSQHLAAEQQKYRRRFKAAFDEGRLDPKDVGFQKDLVVAVVEIAIQIAGLREAVAERGFENDQNTLAAHLRAYSDELSKIIVDDVFPDDSWRQATVAHSKRLRAILKQT